MKNILSALILLLICYSCSDDEKTLAQFSKKDIKITTSDGLNGIYENGNISLSVTVEPFIYHPDEKIQISRACDSYCPVKDHDGKQTLFLARHTIPAIFFCSERSCKAEFDAKTGAPANEQAQGHRLKVYRMDHDRETDTYIVWE